ncbi:MULTISPECIES: ABC transporter ATP-binding protein [unclassified Paenibacillus]|uniref:ABC transporter ATP-binding protein n=1 Tax=unclassified Paenibacillus TaxID=185978 RepID=UPI0003E1C734|nr:MULTISPECIES: ABC transporter ATP-binding protein [unclassified Paenibacillus]ETT32266.1 ABC transporter ATP-binding protein [Paenibacillus sp. FSL R7-269]OMF88519.1 ABC transporter ATP-binding protein [Paenibacillus sp. FSL R7-0337]
MELVLDKLTKQFGRKTAVDQMSIQMQAGVYGMLGANGAGKTTLMRMICGVLKPTQGSVYLDGRTLEDLGENYRSALGYLPQDFGYYPDFTAKDFMLYVAALKGISPQDARIRSSELLAMVGLTEVSAKKIRTFSGGMKQRLGIAQAVLNDPRILVLDEPTAGLDPKERVHFRNLIANFAKDKIVILSTHIVSDLEYISDTILMIKDGKLLINRPADRIAHEMDGKVWRCVLQKKEAEAASRSFCVANLHHGEDDRVVLRVLSDTIPMEGALNEAPTLEDLYLYHFHNNMKEYRGL